jgi:hypothetical protein
MPADRERRSWWASLLGLLLAAEAAEAQGPAPVSATVPIAPPGPVPVAVPMPMPERRVGPIRRVFRGMGRTIHQDLIGIPELFDEPPLGASLGATNAVMRAKAAGHVFTLYRSDFHVDAAELTPMGSGRMARICGDLRGWLGPVVVEATPDKPGLAEARREAVLATLRRGGHDVVNERVVIGPGVAPGLLGTDAGSNYLILINRDQQGPASFSLTPTASTSPGGGGR